ncbi:maturation protein [Citrobacter phage SH5]|uniref:Terminase, large subunit n=2 Tax=Kayfunavirus SH4 TaxID=2733632 RepID=A0A172JGM0_9CAUD|nr:terminase large subunit [Citrobacter phage SH4]AMR59575.1 maturation protein [Citrobacter phage SH4]AMR59650.1 maturation protein [Citrobacter phage SH5]
MTARMKADFVFFLFVLWKALSLPVPTRCQIDMAKKLSAGDNRRFILQAFRGIGKSFITCAFVVWKLWNNPDLKFMIVSASKERADANSIFIKRIIDLMPQLQELKPKQGQRDAVISFDVGPAKPDHSPSVKSVGITGQLTGSRADILIADDVEVPGNSATQAARDRLSELVKEFDAILKPGGTVIYLGTPQTEMTLYRQLEGRGYSTTIWPARYPRDEKDWKSYGDRLAPMLQAELESDPEGYYWRPTDEVRFDDEDLKERELSYGKAGFALQFMLNPNLGDAEKYPLKLRDLIVADLDPESSPMVYQWLPNLQNKREDVPNVGLIGDSYHTYQTVGSAFSSYTQKILVIDPSGRGKDETGYAVLYQLNGYIFVMEAGGMRGGYEDSTLEALAKIGRKWKINEYVIEGNFGDGMYLELFKPVAARIHPAAVTEVKSKGQKELRICDVLEPIMGSHRLIVNSSTIVSDYQTAADKDGVRNPIYSLFYQMTRISRERGALAHDDRLDALAIGVQFFVESMAKDAVKGQREVTEEWLEEQMEDPRKGFKSIETDYWDNGVRVQFNTDDDLGLGSYVQFH